LETSIRGMFVTMIGGRYDPGSGAVQLTNAGHLPALLQPETGPIVEFAADAPPLGILHGAEFVKREFNLGRGALYLYTDGIIESRVNGGGDLGIAGLKVLLRQHKDTPTEQRARKLFDVVRGSEVHDDLTLVVIDSLRDTRELIRRGREGNGTAARQSGNPVRGGKASGHSGSPESRRSAASR